MITDTLTYRTKYENGDMLTREFDRLEKAPKSKREDANNPFRMEVVKIIDYKSLVFHDYSIDDSSVPYVDSYICFYKQLDYNFAIMKDEVRIFSLEELKGFRLLPKTK